MTQCTAGGTYHKEQQQQQQKPHSLMLNQIQSKITQFHKCDIPFLGIFSQELGRGNGKGSKDL